jgi:hypothetical protein
MILDGIPFVDRPVLAVAVLRHLLAACIIQGKKSAHLLGSERRRQVSCLHGYEAHGYC